MINGKKLKMLREAADMSASALGEAVGVSQSMIANIEREFKTPSVGVLVRIADILKVKIDDLIKRNNENDAK